MIVLLSWSIVYIGLCLDRDDDDRATASAAAFEAGQELLEVGCRIAITRSPAQRVEDRLQLARPCDDDADVDRTQVEEQAEVVEVTVVEGILVVPFHFERHAVLVAVHLVGRRVVLGVIHDNPGVELLFLPSQRREMPIQLSRDVGLRAARPENVAAQQGKAAQDGLNVGPFGGPGGGEDGKPIAPLAHVEAGRDVRRYEGMILHDCMMLRHSLSPGAEFVHSMFRCRRCQHALPFT